MSIDRVVCKQGVVNVTRENISDKSKRYFKDIFTTCIDVQWRWVFVIFGGHYVISWFIFALMWFVQALIHGDMEYYQNQDGDKMQDFSTKNSFTPCAREIYSLASAYLLAIETQQSIAYGFRHSTEECASFFIQMLQAIIGLLIQTFMAGIIIAKITRPKRRAENLIFSQNAVIFQRDGFPCLAFRIADTQKTQIIDVKVRAVLIKKRTSSEGENLPLYQQEISLTADGCHGRLMFIWPTVIVHKIDEKSPLYGITKVDENFEIVVMLEGAVESTGLATQAKSSYLPSEILWNHRFESMMEKSEENGKIKVDFDLFNKTTKVCNGDAINDEDKEQAPHDFFNRSNQHHKNGIIINYARKLYQ